MMIQVEQNNSITLERARLQVRKIANAKDLRAVAFQWTWAAGYFMALVSEKLIDEDTKRELDAEADRARDEWKAPTEVKPADCD
ncbi:hypothetical protein ACLD9I_004715 [Pseudomonas aeruginosa]